MFSPDGTLISTPAAPHCGNQKQSSICFLFTLNASYIKKKKNRSGSRHWQHPVNQNFPYRCYRSTRRYPGRTRLVTEDVVSLLNNRCRETISEGDRHQVKPTAVTGHNCFLPYTSLTICLLYTSPSPRDMTISRMPSSA